MDWIPALATSLVVAVMLFIAAVVAYSRVKKENLTLHSEVKHAKDSLSRYLGRIKAMSDDRLSLIRDHAGHIFIWSYPEPKDERDETAGPIGRVSSNFKEGVRLYRCRPEEYVSTQAQETKDFGFATADKAQGLFYLITTGAEGRAVRVDEILVRSEVRNGTIRWRHVRDIASYPVQPGRSVGELARLFEDWNLRQ